MKIEPLTKCNTYFGENKFLSHGDCEQRKKGYKEKKLSFSEVLQRTIKRS